MATLDTRLRRILAGISEVDGARNTLTRQIAQYKTQRKAWAQDEDSVVKAQAFIQEVALDTQRELEFHISSVASLALSAVFPDPYDLRVSFIPKRGKSEALLLFHREGLEVSPMDGSGGGAVDLTSFALRVSMMSLRKTIQRVIVLDEPFRFLSKDLHSRAGQVIRELHERMGIQFIIVTHEAALTEAADRIFLVTKTGPESQIEVLSQDSLT